jgi:PilZ domain
MRPANDGDRTPSAQESRRVPRPRSFLGGKIVFRDGSCSFACTVRDMTDGGARIALEPDQLVPMRFYLITSKREATFDAEVLWRRGALLGVKFHNRLDLSAPQWLFLKTLADELQPRSQGRSVQLAPWE